MIRLGLCCIFRDQPIKFPTTTATAIGKMKRADALVKLSGLSIANADALLVALRFCADNGIGCFRINSQILRSKRIRHADTKSMISPKVTRLLAVSRRAGCSSTSTTCELVFIPISSWS